MNSIIPYLTLALLAAILVSVVLLLLRKGSGPSAQIEDRLAAVERRFVEEIERLRGSQEAAVRGAGQEGAEAQRKLATELSATLRDGFATAQHSLSSTLSEARRAQDERLDRVETALRDFTASFAKATGELREGQTAAFTALQDRVQLRLEEVRRDNAEQLEKIRGTVEEKLQSTLEARLGESFRLVGDRLDKVHQGLGEMQQLATGVGDLKRVLQNVRTRGTFGEVQLGALLEQMLSPGQFATNISTRPGSADRVEYAIRLPGGPEVAQGALWLPIDAKFPQEDYQRLQTAYETADQSGIETSRAALRTRLLGEAQKIQAKYVEPPFTTHFALLFLPTEGLYAEMLRIPGLVEEIQTKWRVVPVGPTNLSGFLNSLSMGFKTLALQQRGTEVWDLLRGVKTEFGKFGDSLEAVGKKLQEASNKVGDVHRRSRAITRKLRDVEALPEPDAARLLSIAAPDDSVDEAEDSPDSSPA